MGVACLGFMSMLFGLSPTYTFLLILALFAGLGFSIITPSANKGVMMETPPGKRAISMGIMQSGGGIGGLAGASLLPLLGEAFGWRMTVQFAGVFIILTALVVFKFYREGARNNNREDKVVNSNENVNEDGMETLPSLKENLCFFLAQKRFLMLCLFGAVLAGSSVGAVLSHFAVFLSEDLNMSRAAAGLGLGVFHVGGMIGRPAWGWVSDRFLKGDREKTLVLLGLVAGIMFLITGSLLHNSYLPPAMVYVFSFFLGFNIFSWPGVLFVAVGEFAGEMRTGAATGLALLSGRVAILTAPPIFGLLADFQGNYSYSWVFFGTLLIVVTFFYHLNSSK